MCLSPPVSVSCCHMTSLLRLFLWSCCVSGVFNTYTCSWIHISQWKWRWVSLAVANHQMLFTICGFVSCYSLLPSSPNKFVSQKVSTHLQDATNSIEFCDLHKTRFLIFQWEWCFKSVYIQILSGFENSIFKYANDISPSVLII